MGTLDAIQRAVIERYYKYTISGLPNDGEQSFPDGNNSISKTVPALQYLVPPATFRPKVFVSFDFTHTFVETLPGKGFVPEEERRLVPKDSLLAYAQKLYVNLSSFLEVITVMTGENGKDTANVDFLKILQLKSSVFDETSANEFINTVINFFLTSVQTNMVRREIGTANITFKDNRNVAGVQGTMPFRLLFANDQSILSQLFVPMLPVKVWVKGRFYQDYYFPIFDGYITNVTPQDNQGFSELQIICKDVLELARISVEMINPAIINQAEVKTIETVNFMSKPFYNHNHSWIVKALFMGGPVKYSPKKFPGNMDQARSDAREFVESGISKVANIFLKNTVNILTGKANISEDADDGSLKFTQLDNFDLLSNLDMGMNYAAGFEKKLEDYIENGAIPENQFSVYEMIARTTHKQKRKLIIWGEEITPYRIFALQGVEIFKADFSSRLDVISDIAQEIYHDFYVDGNGAVHFHPQRFYNDFLINDVSCTTKAGAYKASMPWLGVNIIGPEETVSSSTTLNLDELTTHLRLKGQDDVGIDPEILGVIGKAVHKKYLRKYGYRRREVPSALFNTQLNLGDDGKTFGNLMAACLLIYGNGELYTKEMSIICRPELSTIGVSRPIFCTEDKTVFYLNSVAHSITVGGDATTTINMSFGRKEEETAPDLFNFILATEKAYVVRDNNEIDISKLLSGIPIEAWNEFLDNDDRIIAPADEASLATDVGDA